MVIVITRDGKCAGISTLVGSINTRILTGAANAALCEDLKELSPNKATVDTGMTKYKIEVSEEDGSHRNFIAVHDPNDPWPTPLKRILNETGMINRI